MRKTVEPSELKRRFYKGEDIFPSKDFPLSVMDAAHPASFAAHSHEFIELVFIINGQGIHRFHEAGFSEPRSCGIMPGDVLAIRPGDAHSFVCCSNLQLCNAMFMPGVIAPSLASDLARLPGLRGLFDSSPNPAYKLKMPVSSRAFAISLLKRCKEEAQGRKPAWQAAAVSILAELLVFVGRLPVDKLQPDKGMESSLFKRQAVNRVICFMEENLATEASLEALASKVGLSPSYASRIFKEMTGVSPWEYLVRLRLEGAKALLASSSLSISEIALRCGFCDSSHLAKSFKKHEGRSPKEFRPKGF